MWQFTRILKEEKENFTNTFLLCDFTRIFFSCWETAAAGTFVLLLYWMRKHKDDISEDDDKNMKKKKNWRRYENAF